MISKYIELNYEQIDMCEVFVVETQKSGLDK